MGPDLHHKFIEVFGSRPERTFFVPGRINLIGEHTDYNQGLVLPSAIDRGLYVAVRRGAKFEVYSEIFAKTFVFGQTSSSLTDWQNVAAQIWSQLCKRFANLQPCQIYLQQDLPVGAGLSSSAAYIVALCKSLLVANNKILNGLEVAQLVQEIEHQSHGVRCGIMDPLSICLSRKDASLLVDCAVNTWRLIQHPAGAAWLVIDTGTRRSLAEGAYNERRQACEQIASILNLPSLRHLDDDSLAKARSTLDHRQFGYARHVFSENKRVQAFVDVFAADDLQAAGALLGQSHQSLRQDYAVSSPALDLAVALADADPEVFGARLCGAGFAGCVLALSSKSKLEGVINRLEKALAKESHALPLAQLLPISCVNGAMVEAEP